MRTLRTTLTALTFFLVFVFAGCKKDNSTAPTPTIITGSITSSLTEGSWRVGSFIDNGRDKTTNFTDFKMSFNKNGGVNATGPSTTFTGTWWASSSEKEKLKLNLEFVDQGAFADLTHDWVVVQQGVTQIQLRHDATDDGKNTDFLTLNKNMIK